MRQALGDDAPVTLRSAGLAAAGVAPPRRVVLEMRKRGLDVSAHRSRRLTAQDVEEATLVIGAARNHAWEAVAMVPRAITHTFAYKELVRLGDSAGWREPDESLDDWIERMHEARRSSSPVRVGDDIADPIGRSRRTYARVVAELAELTDRLAPSLGEQDERGPLPPISWRLSGASGSTDDGPGILDG